MNRDQQRGPEYESAEFKRSPAYADFTAALTSVRCATYAQLLDQPRATRDRFHAAWTARMRTRIGASAPTNLDERRELAMSPHRRAIIRLHAEGKTDAEMADALGISRQRAAMVRKAAGLEPNGVMTRNLTLIDAVREGVEAGESDAVIALRLGVDRETVGVIRRVRLGVRRAHWATLTPEAAAKRAEAFAMRTQQGMKLKDIAARFDTDPGTVSKWLRDEHARTLNQAA